MTPLRIAIACLVCASAGHAQAPPPAFDTIVRHGTILDGSGNPRFDADLGIRHGLIVAIGDLAAARAATEIELQFQGEDCRDRGHWAEVRADPGGHGGRRALLRTGNMPSRPMAKGARRLAVKGVSSGSRVVMAVSQRAGARQATGMVTIEAADKTRMMTAARLGVLRAADGWSSLTGVATVPNGDERAFTVIVDRRDPAAPGVATIVVTIDGEKPWRGSLALNEVSTK